MSNIFRKLSLRRDQLAKFLPDQKSIKEFERLFSQDRELYTTIENIIEGAGLNDDGSYDPNLAAKYISIAISLNNADLLLDTAIFDHTRVKIINISSNISLSNENQSVLADATTGNINITLPNPVDCFANSRSFMIGVTKIDSSTNTITILPYASETIVGESSQALLLDGEVLNFISDGINWQIVN